MPAPGHSRTLWRCLIYVHYARQTASAQDHQAHDAQYRLSPVWLSIEFLNRQCLPCLFRRLCRRGSGQSDAIEELPDAYPRQVVMRIV